MIMMRYLSLHVCLIPEDTIPTVDPKGKLWALDNNEVSISNSLVITSAPGVRDVDSWEAVI